MEHRRQLRGSAAADDQIVCGGVGGKTLI